MSWLDGLKELNDLDLADLDFENVGSWPVPKHGHRDAVCRAPCGRLLLSFIGPL